jgi:hypothetical protein
MRTHLGIIKRDREKQRQSHFIPPSTSALTKYWMLKRDNFTVSVNICLSLLGVNLYLTISKIISNRITAQRATCNFLSHVQSDWARKLSITPFVRLYSGDYLSTTFSPERKRSCTALTRLYLFQDQ